MHGSRDKSKRPSLSQPSLPRGFRIHHSSGPHRSWNCRRTGGFLFPHFVVNDLEDAADQLVSSSNMTAIEQIQRHLHEAAAVQQQLAEVASPIIADAAERVAQLVASGGKIMLCGNGGSAGDSQHLAAEFTSRLRAEMERPPIPAIALTTDASYLTARANDYGFEEVFERLVEALGRPGDVLIGITTSGNSKNVIRAVKRCRDRDILTIGFLGSSGGQLARLVDVPIIVPSDSTQHIQESHIAIGHIFCELVEEALYGAEGILCASVAPRKGLKL